MGATPKGGRGTQRRRSITCAPGAHVFDTEPRTKVFGHVKRVDNWR